MLRDRSTIQPTDRICDGVTCNQMVEGSFIQGQLLLQGNQDVLVMASLTFGRFPNEVYQLPGRGICRDGPIVSPCRELNPTR